MGPAPHLKQEALHWAELYCTVLYYTVLYCAEHPVVPVVRDYVAAHVESEEELKKVWLQVAG